MDQKLNQPIFRSKDIPAPPQWMLESMQQPNGSEQSAKNVPPQSEAAKNLSLLEANCPRFRNNWTIQQQQGLDEETWFLTVSHLFSIFDVETALYFSQSSGKHNQRSEERIVKLRSSNSNRPVRCTTFGCSLSEIGICFKNGVRKNDKQEATNSPGSVFFRMRQLTRVGFILDQETGKYKGINENRFARYLVRHQLKILYSNQQFYLYDNHVWKLRDTNFISRKIRDILHSFFPDIWNGKIEGKYMSGLTMETPRVEQMGTDRSKINLKNGIFDLNTIKLVPHDPKYHSTVQLPIQYDPQASCPQFKQFLNDIFEGDPQLITIVGEMFGYCLTAEVKVHKAFILYGKGSNGKSVLSEILKRLCGIENVAAISLSELEKPFARFELVDKLLNLSTENEINSTGLNTTYFKAIVSGDPIRVEQKGETGFTYQPFCKMVLGLNNLPYTKDKSHGFARRLLIIPFLRQFSEKEANVHLTDDLIKELPGILNFAIEGLQRLRSNRYIFTHSDRSNEVLSGYLEELNPVETFVEDMIEVGSVADRVFNKDLRSAFDSWCQDNGHRSLLHYTQLRLNNNIRDIFKKNGVTIDNIKSNGVRGLQGIKLKKNWRSASLQVKEDTCSVGDIDDIE